MMENEDKQYPQNNDHTGSAEKFQAIVSNRHDEIKAASHRNDLIFIPEVSGFPGRILRLLTRIFHTFVFRLVFLAVFRVILDFFVSSYVFRVVLTQFPLSPIGS